jgi:cephalosporin-C deacetylase-like acetyl esterase
MRAALVTASVLVSFSIAAADDASPTARGDAMVTEYFRLETQRLTDESLREIRTVEDWNATRDEYRRQLRDMLGLDPMPERTPLNAVTTGTVDHPEFTVEKLHFQSSPGLYVTGNLYVPKNLKEKAPTILYVCGHAVVKKDGVSYGNKVGYQHHGTWFARHGYVCLVIDTLQLGEIEGIHHGLYREKMWWWLSRGYTSAGVEAWNCTRALDYLESRPEVDASRIGVTGRSGGGAYSWWIAAIDERIKAAVPVAGIASLKNHVVDGCVEGHCDCMYQFNTYRWDYPQVAALVAPRPLLISNTDKDTIFPLDGVVDVHAKTRRIYELLGVPKNLGLQITEGPHEDTQELHIHAFVWMDRFVKGEEAPIDTPAVKLFEPEQLRVFHELPSDSVNARIQEVFVPLADPTVPSREDLEAFAETKVAALREKVFRGWPADSSVSNLQIRETRRQRVGDLELTEYEFSSQSPFRLPLILARSRSAGAVRRVELSIEGQSGWDELSKNLEAGSDAGSNEFLDRLTKRVNGDQVDVVFFAPRGVGPTEWSRDEKERTHIRRRFALLGQTDDGMRVYDVRQAIAAVKAITGCSPQDLSLTGDGDAAVWSLYAAILDPTIKAVKLTNLPETHMTGPQLTNVLRVLDVPQALAIVSSRTSVETSAADSAGK